MECGASSQPAAWSLGVISVRQVSASVGKQILAEQLNAPAGCSEHFVVSLPGCFLRGHLDSPIMHKTDGATSAFIRNWLPEPNHDTTPTTFHGGRSAGL